MALCVPICKHFNWVSAIHDLTFAMANIGSHALMLGSYMLGLPFLCELDFEVISFETDVQEK